LPIYRVKAGGLTVNAGRGHLVRRGLQPWFHGVCINLAYIARNTRSISKLVPMVLPDGHREER